MSKRYSRLLIQDMLQAVEDVRLSINGLDFESFNYSREKINACCFAIHVLGEAVSQLPDEIKELSPAIPWKQVRAYRNRIVHEYFDIDYDFLWQVVYIHMPELEKPLKQLLDKLPGPS